MKGIVLICAAALFAGTCSGEQPQKFISIEERLMQRAKSISIPRVELKDATLAEALEFLRRESRANDPKHEGITIHDPKPWVAASKDEKSRPEGWPLYNPLNERITVSLHNVSLVEALRYVTGLANCRPRPTRTAIAIIPLAISFDPMRTHTIPLAQANASDLARMRSNPKQYFIDSGVYFPDGASCTFEADGTTLVVTNDPEQIDLVHAVLESSVSLNRSKHK
jgi:general secretion pathway protein D